jgi:serine/threonine protein phosphatase PrpC/CRP-like cAMP-binding protein
MKHEAFGKTDIGRVRDHNEDSMLLDQELGLYVVCDGVGGSAAGEVASATACKIIHEFVRDNEQVLKNCRRDANLFNRDKALNLVRDAIRTANQVVYEMAEADPAKRGMACTVVLVLILGPHAVVAHAGDSRVYLVRRDNVYQLTEDHNVAIEYLRRGLITPEQLPTFRKGASITRVIGQQKLLEPDTLFLELMGHDGILLCSDGLSHYLTDRDLLESLGTTKEQDATPELLVSAANERGGHDNITAVVVKADQASEELDAEVDGKFETLRSVSLFKRLSYMELMQVFNISSIATFEAGQRIDAEGERDSRLSVILRGAARVMKDEKTLAEIGRGSFFGEMALIDKSPRSADVVAIKKTRVLEIERRALFGLMNREPHLAIKLMWPMCQVINRRLRQTSDALAWTCGGGLDRSTEPEDALHLLADQIY